MKYNLKEYGTIIGSTLLYGSVVPLAIEYVNYSTSEEFLDLKKLGIVIACSSLNVLLGFTFGKGIANDMRKSRLERMLSKNSKKN